MKDIMTYDELEDLQFNKITNQLWREKFKDTIEDPSFINVFKNCDSYEIIVMLTLIKKENADNGDYLNSEVGRFNKNFLILPTRMNNELTFIRRVFDLNYSNSIKKTSSFSSKPILGNIDLKTDTLLLNNEEYYIRAIRSYTKEFWIRVLSISI